MACTVSTTAATPTPTATPCASVGSWTEQAPYPIAIRGHAVASVGGNVYSFGGIVNNTAITNAYKYSPASNCYADRDRNGCGYIHSNHDADFNSQCHGYGNTYSDGYTNCYA